MMTDADYTKLAPEEPPRKANARQTTGVFSAGGPLTVPELFVWREPALIPPRQFLYGGHRLRKSFSVTIAPGGMGKSSLSIAEALAMASGRNLLGETVHERCRVWYHNADDPLEEIERRLAAASIALKVDPAEFRGQLVITSGFDFPLCLMSKSREALVVNEHAVDVIIATLKKYRVDAFTLDPFIKANQVPENDNPAIDGVAKLLAGVAHECNASVDAVHHVRKGSAGHSEFTVEDGRGATALIDAARSARVLNRMTADEGAKAGVSNHRRYFRVDNGKANYAPPSEASTWFELRSVEIGNGDNVGAVAPWHWPDALDGVTVNHLITVQEQIAAGNWREDPQSKQWAGIAIAKVIGLDIEERSHKAKIKSMLKIWISSGALTVIDGLDDQRKPKKFIRVGEPANA